MKDRGRTTNDGRRTGANRVPLPSQSLSLANLQSPVSTFSPRGWTRHHWSPQIGVEHAGTRERAGLFDETSFAKISVRGRGALKTLQYLCDNDMDRPVGSVTYTQMLNPRGGIECDFTVTRLAADEFQIVTGTAFGAHDLMRIQSHAPDDGSVLVQDVTSQYGCFGLWGPRARDILAGVTKANVSNAAFPYMTAQRIAIGDVPCLALRVTYVGELGWEFYFRMEYGRASCGIRCGRRVNHSAWWRAAIAPSSLCAWKKGIAIGARTWDPTIRRMKRDWDLR